ncbi:MAG TPA: YceI family protein [Gemmatimonadaceae bacterium]|nr:YceI family protein [Gemmatimonadaceae bacterium]
MSSRFMPVGLVLGAGVALLVATASRSGLTPVTQAYANTRSEQARPLDASSGTATRWVIAPTGNEARYRVREQLAGFELPNDAVGATSTITGAIVIDADGTLNRAESRIVVDLRPLRSDRDRRDRYLQNRTLETEQHPTVQIVPTAVRGLSLAQPLTGSRTFELVGDLTVKGVTRPTTWQVTARFEPERVSGSAATVFGFEEFGLTKPRVASVLSVADSIRLEYDFALVKEGGGRP